jgi:hypothetical protein
MLVNKIHGSVVLPSLLGVDNMGAIYMSKNELTGPRTKHIDIHYPFIKDMIRDGELETTYVRTDLNTADILTKNTREETHTKHSDDIYDGDYVGKLIPAASMNRESVRTQSSSIGGSMESDNQDSVNNQDSSDVKISSWQLAVNWTKAKARSKKSYQEALNGTNNNKWKKHQY